MACENRLRPLTRRAVDAIVSHLNGTLSGLNIVSILIR
jgi:hypothetical protein